MDKQYEVDWENPDNFDEEVLLRIYEVLLADEGK